MQPIYLYYYRNIGNPPMDDRPYINKMISESINEENNLIASYQELLDKETNEVNIKIYKSMINDAKTHIRLLETIYGNLNGKVFNEQIEIDDISTNIKDIIYRNVELSKKYRKILYAMKNNTHKYMMFDLVVDTINNDTLLDVLKNS